MWTYSHRWLFAGLLIASTSPALAVDIEPPPEMSFYQDAEQGYEIASSSSILLIHHDGWAVFEHTLLHEHPNPCRFAPEDPETLDKIVDFHVAFRLDPRNLAEIIRADSPPEFSEHYLKDGKLVLTFGLIDPYSAGGLSGARIINVKQGCGRWRYYFPLADGRTFIVDRWRVPELSPALPESATYQRLPGIIPESNEETLFRQMLESFRPTGKKR
jgi:hypothetical protein